METYQGCLEGVVQRLIQIPSMFPWPPYLYQYPVLYWRSHVEDSWSRLQENAVVGVTVFQETQKTNTVNDPEYRIHYLHGSWRALQLFRWVRIIVSALHACTFILRYMMMNPCLALCYHTHEKVVPFSLMSS